MKIPKNFTDLTNRKFGKLTVISRAENYISPSGKNILCGFANAIVEIQKFLGVTH